MCICVSRTPTIIFSAFYFDVFIIVVVIITDEIINTSRGDVKVFTFPGCLPTHLVFQKYLSRPLKKNVASFFYLHQPG